MKTALCVAGVGMVTAIGASTRETLSALAEGKRAIAAAPLVDLGGDPIVGAFARPVSPELDAGRRVFPLARTAVRECLGEAGPSGRGPTALFVCAPFPWGSFGAAFAPLLGEHRDPWPGVAELLAVVLEAEGHTLAAASPAIVRHGHAAGALALQQAAEVFERGDAAQAVIVGLDAHGDRATLERLDLLGALKSRRSPDGFTPGEAAAALCVRPAAPEVRNAVVRGGAVVRGIGLAQERESPSTGSALTEAVSESVAAWAGDPSTIGAVAMDLNGQRERATEWSFAATRTIHRYRAGTTLLHPAGSLGDIGAASLPLLVGVLARGWKISPASLAVASSADGLRGAVLMEVAS